MEVESVTNNHCLIINFDQVADKYYSTFLHDVGTGSSQSCKARKLLSLLEKKQLLPKINIYVPFLDLREVDTLGGFPDIHEGDGF